FPFRACLLNAFKFLIFPTLILQRMTDACRGMGEGWRTGIRRCAARAGFRKTIGFFGVISCWSYEENSWPELFIGERGAANEGMEIIFDHVAKTPRAPK